MRMALIHRGNVRLICALRHATMPGMHLSAVLLSAACALAAAEAPRVAVLPPAVRAVPPALAEACVDAIAERLGGSGLALVERAALAAILAEKSFDPDAAPPRIELADIIVLGSLAGGRDGVEIRLRAVRRADGRVVWTARSVCPSAAVPSACAQAAAGLATALGAVADGGPGGALLAAQRSRERAQALAEGGDLPGAAAEALAALRMDPDDAAAGAILGRAIAAAAARPSTPPARDADPMLDGLRQRIQRLDGLVLRPGAIGQEAKDEAQDARRALYTALVDRGEDAAAMAVAVEMVDRAWRDGVAATRPVRMDLHDLVLPLDRQADLLVASALASRRSGVRWPEHDGGLVGIVKECAGQVRMSTPPCREFARTIALRGVVVPAQPRGSSVTLYRMEKQDLPAGATLLTVDATGVANGRMLLQAWDPATVDCRQAAAGRPWYGVGGSWNGWPRQPAWRPTDWPALVAGEASGIAMERGPEQIQVTMVVAAGAGDLAGWTETPGSVLTRATWLWVRGERDRARDLVRPVAGAGSLQYAMGIRP
jgi:hypothetical protein